MNLTFENDFTKRKFRLKSPNYRFLFIRKSFEVFMNFIVFHVLYHNLHVFVSFCDCFYAA